MAAPRPPAPRSFKRLALLALPALVLGGIAIAFHLRPPAESPEAAPPDAGAPVVGELALTVTVVTGSGSAVEGARVAGAFGELSVEARTDDRGRARVRVPAGARGRITVLADGLARASVQVGPFERGARASLRVELVPGIRIAGVVVDEDARPIANASIEARSDHDGDETPPFTARTGDEGRFAIEHFLAGPARVEVLAAGYERVLSRFEARDGDELRLVVQRTGSIAGIVRGPSGAPASGAAVVLAGSGVWPPRSLPTGEDGRFRFEGVPGGIYEVRAQLGELVAEPVAGLSLVAGGEIDLSLALRAGSALEGVVVRRADGEPIAGAEIVVGEDALSFVPTAGRTDASGRFRIPGLLPRPHRIAVHAEGFVSAQLPMRPPGGEPVRVELVRAATLAGVVLDELDHPVEGAVVEVIGTSDAGEPIALSPADAVFGHDLLAAQLAGPTPVQPSGDLGVTLGEVPPIPLEPGALALAMGGASHGTTGADGRFRIEGVPPGRLQLVGRHPLHAPGMTGVILVTEGDEKDDVRLVLPEGGTIDGRVVDARGFPVAGARVEIHPEREPFARWLLSADDGTFEVTGALGTTVLTAHPAGLAPARETVVVESGATLAVELRVEGELQTLVARTVDERGFPIAGVRVTARSLRPGAGASRTTWSADDGTAEIAAIAPSPWRIEADHESYAPRLLAEVREGRQEIRITLVPGASIVGRALDGWDDAPVPGAEVTLARAGGGSGDAAQTVLTDADGIFELSRVPTGDHTIRIAAPRLLPKSLDARLGARGRTAEDLDLGEIRLDAAGSVSGEVVDALGAPVAGAEVAAGTPPDWTRAARTGPDGAFVLDGLAPGEAAIRARHPGAGESPPVEVAVRARDDTPGQRLHLPDRFDPERAAASGRGHTTGVAIAVRDGAGGTVVITTVRPGSLAAAAGLRAGDVLEAVDEEMVSDAARARVLLRGAAGVEAFLDARRGRGRARRIAVAREAWSE